MLRHPLASACAPLGFLLSFLAVAGAASAADVAAGRKLAERYCARCHNIEKGGPSKMEPPSFTSIAAYRKSEVIFGKIIAPSHPSMPEAAQYLDGDAVKNLVAYIISLEPK